MNKISWKPATILNPVPVAMVSCSDGKGKSNIITLAWVGTINSEPPMVSISIRPSRYSYEMIKNTKEFVINLVTEDLVKKADLCGVKSGKNIDKFKEVGLTAQKSLKVSAPLIKESPVNIECRVANILPLGSHDLFIAEVVGVNVNQDLINKDGKLELEKAKLVAYSHGEYWNLKKSLGFYGYSVADEKVLKRRMKK
jgi:flavin reductase (DIM6/NTAB) family NADH-FMN oxidoreductase RutF